MFIRTLREHYCVALRLAHHRLRRGVTHPGAWICTRRVRICRDRFLRATFVNVSKPRRVDTWGDSAGMVLAPWKAVNSVSTAVSTHCPYCALQCGMDITCNGDRVSVAGNTRFPVNEGGLCLKGWSAAETLRHTDRLLTPLARNEDGRLDAVSWDVAIDRIVSAIRTTQAVHGRDAVGVFGGGSLTNE